VPCRCCKRTFALFCSASRANARYAVRTLSSLSFTRELVAIGLAADDGAGEAMPGLLGVRASDGVLRRERSIWRGVDTGPGLGERWLNWWCAWLLRDTANIAGSDRGCA
jgi:hypothetical protein